MIPNFRRSLAGKFKFEEKLEAALRPVVRQIHCRRCLHRHARARQGIGRLPSLAARKTLDLHAEGTRLDGFWKARITRPTECLCREGHKVFDGSRSEIDPPQASPFFALV